MASAIELLYLSRKQRRQLVLIQFLNAFVDVVGKYKVEEGLLLGVEAGVNLDFGKVCSLFACQRRQCIGDVGEHVEQVAFLGIDDPLHLSHLLGRQSPFRPIPPAALHGCRGRLQMRPQFRFVLEKLWQFCRTATP